MSKKTRTTYRNTYTGDELSVYYPLAFQQIRKEFGLNELIRRTSNEEKLKKQQQKFNSKYMCRSCGSQMTWVEGTNVLVCPNHDCKGRVRVIKTREKDGSEKEITLSSVVNVLLTPHGENVVESLFGV